MTIHPQKKHKPLRLHGEKKKARYIEAWFRDKGCCVECGMWVEEGTPPYHIKLKSRGGGDELENLETLCNECHDKIHN